jgi:hypothetical protein
MPQVDRSFWRLLNNPDPRVAGPSFLGPSRVGALGRSWEETPRIIRIRGTLTQVPLALFLF